MALPPAQSGRQDGGCRADGRNGPGAGGSQAMIGRHAELVAEVAARGAGVDHLVVLGQTRISSRGAHRLKVRVGIYPLVRVP